METYNIDAKGRVPGRVATEVAVLLMGKNRTDFSRNKIPTVEVEVSLEVVGSTVGVSEVSGVDVDAGV